MKRLEAKRISTLRIKEASILFKNKSYSGAYYLAGYSLEMALKACIAKQFKASEIPNKKFVSDIHTHDLVALVKYASLDQERATEAQSNLQFKINWNIVKVWSAEDRYRTFSKTEAEEILSSIKSRNGGILRWIRKHW